MVATSVSLLAAMKQLTLFSNIIVGKFLPALLPMLQLCVLGLDV
jgi:hypothetical protein